VIADKLGYGRLVVLAFATHVLSAFVVLAPTAEMDKGTIYDLLFWGMFLFAYGNGTLEAVAKPMVATLFPEKRNHYLNLLHASWPAGMVLGAVCGWILDDRLGIYWKWQMGVFLVPTFIYGWMFLKQYFPKSAAAEHGLSLGEMFKEVGFLGALVISLLLALFFPSLMPGDAPWESAVSYGLAGLLLIVVTASTGFSLGSWLLFLSLSRTAWSERWNLAPTVGYKT
jgi:MFS family permease